MLSISGARMRRARPVRCQVPAAGLIAFRVDGTLVPKRGAVVAISLVMGAAAIYGMHRGHRRLGCG